MKNLDKIFIINETGVLEVNKPEIRNLKAFKSILERDKGGKVKGDSDGRKKAFAFREFMYIYLVASEYSIYASLPDEARKIKAQKEANLPDKWKEDDLIRTACKKLTELEGASPLRHGYNNAKKAIYSLGEDIKFFNRQKENIKKQIEISYNELENSTAEEDIQRIQLGIDSATNRMLGLSNKILTLSEKLPSTYEILKDFEKKLLDEANAANTIYGGGSLGNREA